MRKTLYDYKESIKSLLLVDKKDNIEIYYAPHNEYINPKAKVFIIGITPGFQQMSTAIATARKELEKSDDIELIQYKCKVAGRFSGTLRKNIIRTVDNSGTNVYIDISNYYYY